MLYIICFCLKRRGVWFEKHVKSLTAHLKLIYNTWTLTDVLWCSEKQSQKQRNTVSQPHLKSRNHASSVCRSLTQFFCKASKRIREQKTKQTQVILNYILKNISIYNTIHIVMEFILFRICAITMFFSYHLQLWTAEDLTSIITNKIINI